MPVDPQKNDVKFFVDSLFDFLKRLGHRIMFWTKLGTALARLAYQGGLIKLNISARQKEIDSHYMALGEYLFFNKGKEGHTDQIINGHFINIKNLEKEIARQESEIKSLQNEYTHKVKKKGGSPPPPESK